MLSQALSEELRRTRGHPLLPISASEVGPHLFLDVCLLGQAMTMTPVTSSQLFQPYPWELGRYKRQGSDKQEGRSGLQSGDLMGQSS